MKFLNHKLTAMFVSVALFFSQAAFATMEAAWIEDPTVDDLETEAIHCPHMVKVKNEQGKVVTKKLNAHKSKSGKCVFE